MSTSDLGVAPAGFLRLTDGAAATLRGGDNLTTAPMADDVSVVSDPAREAGDAARQGGDAAGEQPAAGYVAVVALVQLVELTAALGEDGLLDALLELPLLQPAYFELLQLSDTQLPVVVGNSKVDFCHSLDSRIVADRRLCRGQGHTPAWSNGEPQPLPLLPQADRPAEHAERRSKEDRITL